MADHAKTLARLRADVGGANPFFQAKVARAERLWQTGCDRFGKDGAGFLTALNGGHLWADFWGALASLVGSPLENPMRMPDAWQSQISQMLRSLPRGLRVRVLAQGFFPVTRLPRKSEALFNLMVEELTHPSADLRQWEVGVPKMTSSDAMPDDMLIEVATRFSRRGVQFSHFKAHAEDKNREKAPLGRAPVNAPGVAPLDRGEALAILSGVKVARRHSEGQTEAEVNLIRTQAFHGAMRHVKPGIPEGHLMHLALSSRPSGPTFAQVRWDDFPPSAVWPYIASHLDTVARALDQAPLPWEPALQPIKALKTLTYLPKCPAQLADRVTGFAHSGTKAQKAAAEAALAR